MTWAVTYELPQLRLQIRYKHLAGPSPAADCTQHTQVVLHLMCADLALFYYTSEGSLSLTAVSLIASCHPSWVTGRFLGCVYAWRGRGGGLLLVRVGWGGYTGGKGEKCELVLVYRGDGGRGVAGDAVCV
eukprot:2111778-Rhodomonas_salina.1